MDPEKEEVTAKLFSQEPCRSPSTYHAISLMFPLGILGEKQILNVDLGVVTLVKECQIFSPEADSVSQTVL